MPFKYLIMKIYYFKIKFENKNDLDNFGTDFLFKNAISKLIKLDIRTLKYFKQKF